MQRGGLDHIAQKPVECLTGKLKKKNVLVLLLYRNGCNIKILAYEPKIL